MGSLRFDTSSGIPPAGITRVNPMLTKMAQREGEIDFLDVLRAAKSEGMQVMIGGRLSGLESPPDPTLPFSVFWFNDDHDRYGRIGVGMTSGRHGTSQGGPIMIQTEESWHVKEAEDVDDPTQDPGLMRWSDDQGWFNDHVVYLVEARPYRFLINWCMTGFKPVMAQQSSQPQVDARTR